MHHREALIVALVVLMAGAAEAQDFGLSAPAGSAEPSASFDGAYVGFSGSLSRIDGGFASNSGLLNQNSVDDDHFAAGFHAGYGATFGSIYLGGEGEVRFFDDEGYSDGVAYSGSNIPRPGEIRRLSRRAEIYQQRLRGAASAKLKAGLPVGRFMPFVTGGLSAGYSDTDYLGFSSVETSLNGQLIGRSEYVAAVSGNEFQFGYNVGAGLEYLVSENISLRGEYAFTDLGTQRYVFESPTAQDLEVEFDTKVHEARLGFSFHF
tara:strand:- start:180 stop:968 length:789 start_codon:yes stop_codon:yes gene_type:complete